MTRSMMSMDSRPRSVLNLRSGVMVSRGMLSKREDIISAMRVKISLFIAILDFVHCYSGFCLLLFWILFLYAVGKGGSDVFPWCHVEVGGEWVVIAYESDFGVVDVVAIYDVEGEGIGRGNGEVVEMDVTNGKLTHTLDVGSGVVGGIVLAEVVDACVDLLLEGGVPLLRLLEIDVGKVDVVEEGSETARAHTDVEGGYGLVDIQDALAGIP